MNKLNKVKKFCKDNSMELITFASVVFLFYMLLMQCGISTHDELQSITKTRMGNYFEFDHGYFARWGMAILAILPTYIQSIATSMWIYRAFTIVGLMFSNMMMMYLLYKHVDKKITWIYPMIFFMFAQLNTYEHNGLYSFAFNYQYIIGVLFLSLNLYLCYLKTKKKSYLIWSAITYLIVSMAYEAFILFGVVYFILDLYHYIKCKNVKIINLLKDLGLHAGLVILYVLSYYMIRTVTGAVNADSEVGAQLTLYGVCKTIWTFAIALFPLNLKAYDFNTLVDSMFSVDTLNIMRLFIIVLLSGVFVNMLKNIQYKISLKVYFLLSCLLLVCTLLPTVLTGITGRFVSWVESGVRSFGVSYYSYYFIVAWIVLSMVFIYQKCKYKKIISIIIFIFVVIITELTQISNMVYAEELNRFQAKVDLIDDIINTDYFEDVEDDAVIFMEQYVGIHERIDSIAEYINSETGKNITVVNKEEQVDFSKPVYIFTINQDSKVGILAKVKESTLEYVSEMIIYSENTVEDFRLIGDIDKEQNVYLNGTFIGTYSDFVFTDILKDKVNCVKYTFDEIKVGNYDFVKY